MSKAAQPELEPGRAYRTRELRQWSANPSRLARRLVKEGKLREAAHGIYYAPIPTRFGPAPPPSEELLRAFLDGEPFLLTGPLYWNALNLGSTSMFAVTLAYNTKRSGEFKFEGRRILLRRVAFPENPTPEWFIIDLLKHHGMAGVALSELRQGLEASLRLGRWDRERLREMAETYGTKATLALVEQVLKETEPGL
ncbi:hypothetical protein FRD01_13370 [Microvenator marinus]|uniref:Transcriptional regulator, AbiEi antitoxin, Type IV TA system n=1 Tax=Microvenator marinus TaxID=2600177 RepID=A0A5B8XRN4_9DELT|nr:hypothetical protein [Microvenator marinus]QED28204.1 hypothetical protein FRD01_13370 [Microvenator marinus]